MKSTELLKGTLIPIILKLLSDNGKMYGYELTQKVKELSKERILLKEGSLYPALHKLLDDGVIDVEVMNIGNRVRKYYFLTKKGHEQKTAHFNELKEFINTIQQIIFPQFNPEKNAFGT